MSISSRDIDKKTGEPKKGSLVDKDEDNKKYLRVWRIETSKEFILLMAVIVMAIGFSIFSPLKLLDIAEQNKQSTAQNLNNTDRIIKYLDISDDNRTAASMDLIKVLLLYNQDHERDLAKLLNAAGIPNRHYVDINGTHVITEAAITKLPYPIDIAGFTPINNTFVGYDYNDSNKEQ